MVTAVEKKTKAALARQVKRRTCVLVIIPYYENNVDFIKCLVTAVAFVVAAGACVYVLNKAVSLSVFISMLFSLVTIPYVWLWYNYTDAYQNERNL